MDRLQRKVLQLIINEGPIIANKIRIACQIEKEDNDPSNRNVRTIIADLTKDGWPIASGNSGFYLAYERRDKRKYKRRLWAYIKGIRLRIKEFNGAWRKFKSDENYYMHIIQESRRSKRRKIKRRKKS